MHKTKFNIHHEQLYEWQPIKDVEALISDRNKLLLLSVNALNSRHLVLTKLLLKCSLLLDIRHVPFTTASSIIRVKAIP